MTSKAKETIGAISDALETACGWAIGVVLAYGILFVDLTGNGRLWDAIRGTLVNTYEPPIVRQGDYAVQMRLVPVRPEDMRVKAQNKLLQIPMGPDEEMKVPVVAPTPSANADRVSDAPSDAGAAREWRTHLTSQLRSVAVYGHGEQAPLGGFQAPGAPVADGSNLSPTAKNQTPAYAAGQTARARPGIGSRPSQVTPNGKDGVRNFR
jgi:hypothetical protein